MTAIETITALGQQAGFTIRMHTTRRTAEFRLGSTVRDARLVVDFDKTGRLITASRWDVEDRVWRTMPAAGLAARLTNWFTANGPAYAAPTPDPEPEAPLPNVTAGETVFDELDRQYAAEDSFAANPQGRGSIGPARPAPSAPETPHPFEASWSGRTCSRMVLRDGFGVDCGQGPDAPVHDDPYAGQDFDFGRGGVVNVASGNATVGQQLGHVGIVVEAADLGVRTVPEGRLPRPTPPGELVTLDVHGAGFEVGVWDERERDHVHGLTLDEDAARELWGLLDDHFGDHPGGR